MGAAAEIRRNPVSVENEQADAGRDGTAEPVSRDCQILRRERGQREILFFSVQLTTSRIGHPTG